MNSIHTYVILAYKESQYLEDCIKDDINDDGKIRIMDTVLDEENFVDKSLLFSLNLLSLHYTMQLTRTK